MHDIEQSNNYILSTLTHFMSRSLSIPPENIRKPLVFCLQGVQKETNGIKWVHDAQ